MIYTGNRKTRPEHLRLSEEFWGGGECAVEVRVKMIYDGKKGDIISQYVAFTRVYNEQIKLHGLFFASTFSSKMQIEFLKVAWGISPVLHFLRRHSFRCRRGAVAGIQSLLVTDM